MKLSFTTLGCPEWNLTTVAEKAAEYGYDGVELLIRGGIHIDTAMSAAERKQVSELFRSRNLEIRSLSGYTKFASSEKAELEHNIQQLRLNAELAHDLGASYVRTFIGEPSSGVDNAEAIARAGESLAVAVDSIAPLGVEVIIETHDHFSAAEAIEAIIGKAGNPQGLAVLWDTVHTHHIGEKPRDVCERIGSLIRHVHLKDAVPGKPGGKPHQYVLTGEGNMPIRENVEALHAIGYDGYLSLEWEKMWYPDLEEPSIAFPHYVKVMRELLAKLR